MAWPGIDYHNHLIRNPLDAMLSSAREQRVREFGITEHVYMLHEGHEVFPHLQESGKRFDLAWYVDTVRSRAAREPAIALRLGLEVDFIPGTEPAVLALLGGIEWDYLMGSVHEIDGRDLFEYLPTGAEEGERLWRRYFELTAEAIESGMFDVITHPVRNAERNPYLPPEFDGLLAEVAAFAKLHGVALELNGYDTVNWPDLVERLARACARTGCAVSFGSDAHVATDVARGMHEAAALAGAAGVSAAITCSRRERRLVSF